MKSAKHEDFRVRRMISLWLGNFRSENELDTYLTSEFERDFSFEIYPPDGPECDVVEQGSEPIDKLLEGFSRWNTFVEEAALEAHKKGWEKATTAVVFYNFKYEPEFINPEASKKLIFIAAVPYGGFS